MTHSHQNEQFDLSLLTEIDDSEIEPSIIIIYICIKPGNCMFYFYFITKESYGRTYMLKLTQKFFDYFELKSEKDIEKKFGKLAIIK